MLDPLLRPVQRLAQAGFVDRLQQVVDRVDLECAYRVLVIGRHERDERQLMLLQHPHHADAVELGHLQVQQRQIRPFALDRRHRLRAGPRLGHNHDVFEGAQQRGEKRPCRPFVVGNHDAETCVHEAVCADTRSAANRKSAGRRISTVVPAPGSLPIDRLAAEP
jgi:hypothetical protein